MLTTSHDTKFLDKGTKKLEMMFKDVQNELQVYTNIEKRVSTCIFMYMYFKRILICNDDR
jgi:hypothetical protein